MVASQQMLTRPANPWVAAGGGQKRNWEKVEKGQVLHMRHAKFFVASSCLTKGKTTHAWSAAARRQQRSTRVVYAPEWGTKRA